MDEANSAIGIALSHVESGVDRARLSMIQNELFDLGADLATPGTDFQPTEMALRVTQEQVARLEREIDEMNEELEPLRSFILPAGEGGAAYLHLARAIVRRAERSAVAAAISSNLNPHALTYLNRLSDHLFVFARKAAKTKGGESLWKPGATRADA